MCRERVKCEEVRREEVMQEVRSVVVKCEGKVMVAGDVWSREVVRREVVKSEGVSREAVKCNVWSWTGSSLRIDNMMVKECTLFLQGGYRD